MYSFWLGRIFLNFTLLFGEADFLRIKGRETFSRSHNDLNTTYDNAGLIESFVT
jgi:hypothetical protein